MGSSLLASHHGFVCVNMLVRIPPKAHMSFLLERYPLSAKRFSGDIYRLDPHPASLEYSSLVANPKSDTATCQQQAAPASRRNKIFSGLRSRLESKKGIAYYMSALSITMRGIWIAELTDRHPAHGNTLLPQEFVQKF